MDEELARVTNRLIGLCHLNTDYVETLTSEDISPILCQVYEHIVDLNTRLAFIEHVASGQLKVNHLRTRFEEGSNVYTP